MRCASCGHDVNDRLMLIRDVIVNYGYDALMTYMISFAINRSDFN